MRVELQKMGGGPNPETDDCFTIIIDDVIYGYYVSRKDVTNLMIKIIEQEMNDAA